MAGYHQHLAVRKTARNGPDVHPFLPALVDPDDLRVLDSRVDREPLGYAFQIARDPMSVRAEQTGELDAARILTQPIFNRIQLAVRRVGRDDETFLDDSGVHPRQHISRSLPIDEGREQQNASRKHDGSPTEGRGADEIRKFHEE